MEEQYEYGANYYLDTETGEYLKGGKLGGPLDEWLIKHEDPKTRETYYTRNPRYTGPWVWMDDEWVEHEEIGRNRELREELFAELRRRGVLPPARQLTRTCPKCRLDKPWTEEHFSMKQKYNDAVCKECRRKQAKEARSKRARAKELMNQVLEQLGEPPPDMTEEQQAARNAEIKRALAYATSPTKECKRCGEVLQRTDEHFYIRQKSKDGLDPYCKRCRDEANRQSRESKREQLGPKPTDYACCTCAAIDKNVKAREFVYDLPGCPKDVVAPVCYECYRRVTYGPYGGRAMHINPDVVKLVPKSEIRPQDAEDPGKFARYSEDDDGEEDEDGDEYPQ